MLRGRAPLISLLSLLLGLAAGCAQAPPPAWVGVAPEAVDAARSAIVVVHSRGERSNGVVVSPEGVVLSVRHGLRSDAPTVELADGTRVRARVAFLDPLRDLAVLELPRREGGYDALEPEGGARTSDDVIVLARQTDYPQLVVRRGILFMQGINLSSRDSDYGGGWTVENAYVHGAAVDYGHSGSALLDDEGRLLGINVAGSHTPGSTITLALPVDEFRPLIDRLSRARDGVLPHVDAAPRLDLEDPAQRCAWVLDGLERHARHAGIPAEHAAQLMAQVREEALSLYLAGDLDSDTLVPWSWRQGLAVLGLATAQAEAAH